MYTSLNPDLNGLNEEIQSYQRDNLSREKEEKVELIIKKAGRLNKKCFYQVIALISIILDVPFIFFLIVAIHDGLSYGLSQFGLSSYFLNVVIYMFASFLAALSTFCDVSIANPTESVKEFLSNEDALNNEIKSLGRCRNNAIRTLNVFNQFSSNVIYVIGSAANALPVAYLSSNPFAQWITGFPIVMFGMVYCNMISWKPVKKHAYEFLSRLLSLQEFMIVNIFLFPAKTLELIIQTVSNAFYRGAFFGYTMNQVLQLIFNQAEDNPKNIYYLCVVAILSIYITFFSRTLNVHKQLFNENWDRVSSELLQSTRISCVGLMLDLLIAALRAVPIGVLIYQYGNNEASVNLSIASVVGVLVLLQALYVRYNRRLYRTALQQNAIKDKWLSVSPFETDHTASVIFEMLAEEFKTEKLKNRVTYINGGARLGRSLAFLGFLVELNKTLASHNIINLDFLTLLCLHQLWGNTSLENEFSFFQESIIENLADYYTKIHIEKTAPLYGWGAFWTAKSEYPVEHLRLLLPRTDVEFDEQEVNPEIEDSAMLNSNRPQPHPHPEI